MITPPCRTKGASHGRRRSSGATARATTQSNCPARAGIFATSSARAWTVFTSGQPSASAAARQKSSFFAVESSSVTCRSGRTIFRASPGSPGPVPTSTIREFSGRTTTVSSASESRKCFTAISRGEVSRVKFIRVAFHSTISAANCSNCSIWASLSPNFHTSFAPRRTISPTVSNILTNWRPESVFPAELPGNYR